MRLRARKKSARRRCAWASDTCTPSICCRTAWYTSFSSPSFMQFTRIARKAGSLQSRISARRRRTMCATDRVLPTPGRPEMYMRPPTPVDTASRNLAASDSTSSARHGIRSGTASNRIFASAARSGGSGVASSSTARLRLPNARGNGAIGLCANSWRNGAALRSCSRAIRARIASSSSSSSFASLARCSADTTSRTSLPDTSKTSGYSSMARRTVSRHQCRDEAADTRPCES
mmetsp:Transcript_15991/g.49959  ORF Transcript_15991/g.49959 Transcript_15991/m.49959 type:complete len:232 (-) Transcript_15991:315-1010(-)